MKQIYNIIIFGYDKKIAYFNNDFENKSNITIDGIINKYCYVD